MPGVQRHAPSCSCCGGPTNLTVLVKGCNNIGEPGATVTVRVSNTQALVGTCTTDANGQCKFAATSNDFTITAVSATYTSTQTIFIFGSINTTVTFAHPGCACYNTWPTTLTLTDPWGQLTMTKSVGATTSSWATYRMISVQGAATPQDCGNPGPISLRLQYGISCVTDFIEGLSFRLQVQWFVCGSTGNPTSIPAWVQDDTGAIRSPWTAQIDISYIGVLEYKNFPVCQRLCSDPPNFSASFNFTGLGASGNTVTTTVPA